MAPRYTQLEVDEILRRALDRSVGVDGLEHHELIDVAREVGIDRDAVELAVRDIEAERALEAGKIQNLRRAAEMTAVPDERVLEIYNALRPYRSSAEELAAIADELESQYGAKVCANFVREAAGVYEARDVLKKD